MAETVKLYLASQEVEYTLVVHRRSQSNREAAAAAQVPDDHIAKAVILKDDKGLLMAVIPGDHWIRLHALQEALDRNLELAPESDVDALFPDCRPGAVPPLGPAYELETVLDANLPALAVVYFESGDHEYLVRVSGDDFRRLLRGVRQGFFSHAG